MISFVLPTRNRPALLAETLAGIGRLDGASLAAAGGAEVIVVDNASSPAASGPDRLGCGAPVRFVRRAENEGAAARNAGVDAACGEWIVMLDDDSHPRDTGFVAALRAAPRDVAAIGAEIVLPDGSREAGGLPEVFIGCGVAIRREAFVRAGGYDAAFHYYAEEYDLAAKFLLAGWRVTHDRQFRVAHMKSAQGRRMNTILRRLVRNNAWIAQRYAPEEERRQRICEDVLRYARIARKERALAGYAAGLGETLAGLEHQPRREMTREQFDRFTGLAAARRGLAMDARLARAHRVAIVDRGKNDWAIERALREMGREIVADARSAETLVIGTLSPGPMMDAWEHRAARGEPVAWAWSFDGDGGQGARAAAA